MKKLATIVLISLAVLSSSCEKEEIAPTPQIEGSWHAYNMGVALYDSLQFGESEVRIWKNGISDIMFYKVHEEAEYIQFDKIAFLVPYTFFKTEEANTWLLLDFVDNRGWEQYYRPERSIK